MSNVNFDHFQEMKPQEVERVKNLLKFTEIKPSREELLKAFNSGETVEDGLEEVFRLGQRHFLAK